MTLSGAFNAFKSSKFISWKSTGKLQQTLASCVERTGTTLHSGKISTVRLWPELAGEGRRFEFRATAIPASIDYSEESPLCTTLLRDGVRVRTVEHLLSALEATGVDNCRIEVESSVRDNQDVEVPIFDGSAGKWVETIAGVGLKATMDRSGNVREKMAAKVNEAVHISKNGSFISAFPSPEIRITYGIDFPQVPSIGCQWFSSTAFDSSYYSEQIAPARTFCVYEEVEKMQKAGLIKGGTLESAIVCRSDVLIQDPDLNASKGWLNPPLRFDDEPCRHKVLDLIGDLSLYARSGSQGIPIAHFIVYKGGHALHADLARQLLTTT